MFAEDLQRFQSMKSEMVALDNVKQDAIHRKKEESDRLEVQVALL
jgi:hypothetical protein